MRWTTESAGPTRTTMQVAMEEATLRKRFADSVSFLSRLVAAFKQMTKALGEALVSLGRAFVALGRAFSGTSTSSTPYPGAISFERRGARSGYALVAP